MEPLSIVNVRRTASTRYATGVALLAATGALLLAGCSTASSQATPSASGSSSATSCTPQADGAAAKSVKVTGEFGKKPSVTFTKPLEATDMQVHVLNPGDGATTKDGDAVTAVISVFSAKTGKLGISEPASLAVGDASVLPAFLAGMDCVPIGSRVVTVVPPEKLFGATGNESLGIGSNETVIIVTDIQKVTAPPTVSQWSTDVPQVSFDSSGMPTVKLPGKKAPQGVQVKVLKEGDGATVAAGDQITVDYQGLTWKDGKVFDQSYGAQAATFTTSGVIPGFSAAVVGQKVGTQLLVSIPAEYAYPKGSGSAIAGEDLVFLIDIKSVGAASGAPSASASQ